MNATNSPVPDNNRSYLIRVRQPSADEPHSWRISCEDLATGKRLGFATYEAFLAFCESCITQPEGLPGACQPASDDTGS